MRREKANMNESVAGLKKTLRTVVASFNALFQVPRGTDLELKSFDHNEPLGLLKLILRAVAAELSALDDSTANPAILASEVEIISNPDAVDYLNSLIATTGSVPLAKTITAAVLDIMTSGRLFEIDDDTDVRDDALLNFQLGHARVIAEEGTKLLREYCELLETTDPLRFGKLRPDAKEFLAEANQIFENDDASISLAARLREEALKSDSFRTSRVFRCSGANFISAEIADIRPVTDFFGYTETRRLFKEYFANFSKKNENFPLLITSLPGLGKTHMTISFALSFENLTLILPEPEDLERPLEKIIKTLSQRKNRKFVLFFDDVDTRKVNWYYFRTFVGGSYKLPSNICIVIASNLEFPANISSRGRGFSFPIFDEIECQQMVEDFLRHMGMSNPPSSLVSVIAADYVEQFAQHAFEELSPRTLVRYLERYDKDMKKRAKMLELSRGEVITKPDAQIFFETNQKLKERLSAF